MFFEDHLLEASDTDEPMAALQDTQMDETAPASSSQALPRPTPAAGSSSLIQLLIEATENERHCPDVLPYPTAVIDGVITQVAHRRAHIQELSESEKQAAAADPARFSLLPFRPSDVMALELQRIQFFLCELLRCRLRKIDALCTAIYYEGVLAAGGVGGDAMPVRVPQREHLSPNEQVVADRLATSKHNAILQTGMQTVPECLQHLTPNLPHGEGLEILPEPCLSTYVFGVALEDLGVVQVGEAAEQTIQAGDIFLMPYRTFRPYVISGQVRLV